MTQVFLALMALAATGLLVGVATRRIRISSCCGIPAERDLRMRDAFTDQP